MNEKIFQFWIINPIDDFCDNLTIFFLPFSIPGNPHLFITFLPLEEFHFYCNCKKEEIFSGNRTYRTSARVKQCFWQRNTAPSKDRYFHG